MIINEGEIIYDEDLIYDWKYNGDDEKPSYCCNDCNECCIGCGV